MLSRSTQGRGFELGKRRGQSFRLGATRMDPGRRRGQAAFGMRPGLHFGFVGAESGGSVEAGPRASVSFGDSRV